MFPEELCKCSLQSLRLMYSHAFFVFRYGGGFIIYYFKLRKDAGLNLLRKDALESCKNISVLETPHISYKQRWYWIFILMVRFFLNHSWTLASCLSNIQHGKTLTEIGTRCTPISTFSYISDLVSSHPNRHTQSWGKKITWIVLVLAQ